MEIGTIQPAAAPDAKPRDRQRRQRLHRAADRHQHGRERAHHGDGAILAEAVADRADDELDRAVAEGIGGDHDRGGAHRGAEIGAICGSSELVTRTIAWLAKPATASRMMERVGTLLGWSD